MDERIFMRMCVHVRAYICMYVVKLTPNSVPDKPKGNKHYGVKSL